MLSPVRGVHGVTQRKEEVGRREVARRIKGEIKRGESNLASNQFPMCTPQSLPLRDVHRDVHGVTQRREEGGRRQR